MEKLQEGQKGERDIWLKAVRGKSGRKRRWGAEPRIPAAQLRALHGDKSGLPLFKVILEGAAVNTKYCLPWENLKSQSRRATWACPGSDPGTFGESPPTQTWKTPGCYGCSTGGRAAWRDWEDASLSVTESLRQKHKDQRDNHEPRNICQMWM